MTERMTTRPNAFLVLICLTDLCLMRSWTFAAAQADPGTLERYFREGEKALAEKRLDDAARAYQKLAQLDPKTAEVQAKLGFIYYQQGKFAEAVPAFRQALKLKPSLPSADALLAICLSELGHYAEALPGLEKGFRSPPESSVRRLMGLQLQRSYVGLQRYHKAAEVALELSRLYPEDAEVLYHNGRFYGDLAYLTMRKLTQIAPESVWMFQAEGEALESQGHYDLAIRKYRKVLALEGARPGIHFRIGRAILSGPQEANSQNEALKEFEQELQIDATNASAAYEMGEIYRKQRELEQAGKFFNISVEHYPDFEEAQIGLGRVLSDLKQPEKALPHLQAAIRLNPENEVSHYQLALVYKALGNASGQQKELREFQRLRTKEPPQQEAAPFKLREVTRQELDSEIAQ